MGLRNPPLSPVIVHKTAAQTANSTTLQDDDHLKLSVGASEVWFVMLLIKHSNPSTTGDIKVGFTQPAGATVGFTSAAFTAADAANFLGTNDGAASMTGGSTSGIRQMLIYGTIANSTTAGTLQVQWAENATDATNVTTVAVNSCLIAWRLG